MEQMDALVLHEDASMPDYLHIVIQVLADFKQSMRHVMPVIDYLQESTDRVSTQVFRSRSLARSICPSPLPSLARSLRPSPFSPSVPPSLRPSPPPALPLSLFLSPFSPFKSLPLSLSPSLPLCPFLAHSPFSLPSPFLSLSPSLPLILSLSLSFSFSFSLLSLCADPSTRRSWSEWKSTVGAIWCGAVWASS